MKTAAKIGIGVGVVAAVSLGGLYLVGRRQLRFGQGQGAFNDFIASPDEQARSLQVAQLVAYQPPMHGRAAMRLRNSRPEHRINDAVSVVMHTPTELHVVGYGCEIKPGLRAARRKLGRIWLTPMQPTDFSPLGYAYQTQGIVNVMTPTAPTPYQALQHILQMSPYLGTCRGSR